MIPYNQICIAASVCNFAAIAAVFAGQPLLALPLVGASAALIAVWFWQFGRASDKLHKSLKSP